MAITHHQDVIHLIGVSSAYRRRRFVDSSRGYARCVLSCRTGEAGSCSPAGSIQLTRVSVGAIDERRSDGTIRRHS
jgi:hypothetical protein